MAYLEGDGPAATSRFKTRAAYLDAVGDLGVIGPKWGPSVSVFQIRTLRRPSDYEYPDTLRVAATLHDDPRAAAQAAYAISRRGSDFRQWSVFTNGDYLAHKGKDFVLRSGHQRAAEWSR